MDNDLPILFKLHPAGVIGSFVAGQPPTRAARKDAEPLVEQPTVWTRVRKVRFRWPLYRPALSS
jgi:hypothetical protein